MSGIYDEIGVRTVVHGGGTKTTMGGSRMAPEVVAAIAEASERFVPVAELNERIGAFIADVTGAEDGMVTSGAGSGVVLSAAACVAGTDHARVLRLPDTTGMRDEIAIHLVHQGKYSHMYAHSGARLVEFGNINDTHPRELESILSERTAAVAYLLGPGIPRSGLTLAESVAIAHAHGVPVIVDAAAMLPPRANLRRFIEEGADLVTFSGGKLIHGPQATGMLFGRRDLVEAARANANPHHAIGRSHKVSREDMVGFYVALRRYLQLDECALLGEYRARAEAVVRPLPARPGLDVAVEHDDDRHAVPTAVLRFGARWEGPAPATVAAQLFAGDPRIFVIVDRGRRELHVNPISLQAGEPEFVGARLAEELAR